MRFEFKILSIFFTSDTASFLKLPIGIACKKVAYSIEVLINHGAFTNRHRGGFAYTGVIVFITNKYMIMVKKVLLNPQQIMRKLSHPS